MALIFHLQLLEDLWDLLVFFQAQLLQAFEDEGKEEIKNIDSDEVVYVKWRDFLEAGRSMYSSHYAEVNQIHKHSPQEDFVSFKHRPADHKAEEHHECCRENVLNASMHNLSR